MTSVWESAAQAVIAADAAALQRLLDENRKLFDGEPAPPYVPSGPGPAYAAADARTVIAREHQFESWSELAEHLEARRQPGSAAARFEAAVDAVVAGDAPALRRILGEDPELVRARSPRKHHATLLHYVGANGVEGFRQKTPKDAARIAGILLDAGAEVDAAADVYGGSTTLELAATSIHPLLAGVQNTLIDVLLQRGADLGSGIVHACLANGREGAARHLASRGAPLDLEGAAGVGRLDVVRSFFDGRGRLASGATEAQMKDGFAWACEFGRAEVVDFLLERGMPVDAPLKHHGQTGLHWAACGGHVATVRVLLGRKAPVDAADPTWGNTPLGWALFGWRGSPRDDHSEVAALLVAAGASVRPEWLADEKVKADARMLAALGASGRS